MAKLAFFGTPDFAVASLDALLAMTQHEVALVVCQADKRKGRGKKFQAPPVKVRALEAGVEVTQPSTLKKGTEDGEAFFAKFQALELDLAIVAAYGRILSTRILKTPKRGMVNVHGSLLPRWRGAAPVQRAIEADDNETGVCLMDMVFALDAGDVYAEAKTPIHDDDDAASLFARVASLGGEMLTRHLDSILDGSLQKAPQSADGVTYADMMKKDEAVVDWTRSAREIFCGARARVGWPGTQSTLDGDVIKLFSPRVTDDDAPRPGVVVRADDALVVGTGEGCIAFAEAQLPSKKRMAVSDLVRGRPITPGVTLG